MNSSRKAQMKIQQMAFMLVAVMIFFAMVAIVYFTIVFARIQDTADDLREREAKELARQMSSTPELMFSQGSSPFSASLDFDKAHFLSQNLDFKRKYWNLEYLMIEKVYPPPTQNQEDCALYYPDCKELVIIDNANGMYAGTQTAPVALVWWDETLENGGGYRFEFGRVHALANDPTN